MSINLYSLEPMAWSQLHFGGASFSHPARARRLCTLSAAMATHPDHSIPQLAASPYAVKASYTFLDHPETTPEIIQAPHQALVQAELTRPGTHLILHDATEFNWPDTIPRAGLGAMHKGYQGFLVHSSLAVKWSWNHQTRREPLTILGLMHQTFHARVPKPVDEANDASYQRKFRARESDLWFDSLNALESNFLDKAARLGMNGTFRAIPRLGENGTYRASPPSGPVRPLDGSEIIHVCDRGADIHRLMKKCQDLNHRFIIRAAQNRNVVDEHEKSIGKSISIARQQSSLGQFDLDLRARPGQKARIAALSVSTVRMTLKPQQVPKEQREAHRAIDCTMVRVWEAHPPAGLEGLEWLLLCDREVTSFEQALECACMYAARWLIEEFHKCLKTGLKAAELQLETANRLFAAIAVKSIIAVRLLALKENFRIDPQRSAISCGLDPLELEVLVAVSGKTLKTVREVGLALGRLGGHMNRKADGMPGWMTLWRGMDRLQSLVEGVRLARLLPSFG